VRRTTLLVSSLAVLGSLLAGVLGAQQQPLEYRLSDDPRTSEITVRSVELKTTTGAPDGVQLPEFLTEDARFAKWETPRAPAGHVWLALDRSEANPNYDRLYIDSDCDGSLADEEAAETRAASRNRSLFGSVSVAFPAGDGDPVAFHIDADCRPPADSARSVRGPISAADWRIQVSSAGWYEGTVTIGDKQFDLRLIDYNSNGTFDDTSTDFSDADRILVGEAGNYGRIFTGRYVRIGEDYYHPSPARDGAFIGLTEADNASLGTIRMSADVGELAIGGENGLLTLNGSDRAAAVPAGKWHISHWQTSRKDNRGATWTLKGSGLGNNGIFDLAGGGEATLDVGEPLVATLTVSRKGSTCTFNETLKGHRGESVTLEKNGQRAPLPRVRITNEDGTYNRLYSFRRG
jgi:hypothetical protein